MNPLLRLGAFVAGLGVIFAGAYGIGQLTGSPAPAAAEQADPAGAVHPPGGLQVSEGGYTFVPVTAPDGEFAFQVLGPDRRPVTGFEVQHDQRMHLIAVRRDLSGFRHVHPELDPDGTWRVASPVDAPGSWRLFADFKPTGGEPLTLGVDLHVPGEFEPRPLPAPARATTVDGYRVEIAGELEPGGSSELTLTVGRNGAPVTDLEPYLGAYGHLVVLRDGDLAYLHVHPDEASASPGPAIRFYAEVPSAGAYRLFLDFQHAGAVHTAEFTMLAGTGTAPTQGERDHGHD
jgi:hypothetical protein